MVLFCFLFIALGPDQVQPKKAYIQPLPLEDERDPRTYLSSVKQMIVDRDLLYVRTSSAPEILVFNRSFEFAFAIGGRGSGPGKFKAAISGMSVANGNVWLFESDAFLSHFQGDHFVKNIPIKGVQVSVRGSSTAAFAADENVILLSAHPKTRGLGVVYAHDGKLLQSVGDIFPIDRNDLQRNPALNDVLWVRGENHWYAVFEYHPLVQKFDESLQLVDEFDFHTQLVDDFHDRWQDWQPEKGWRIPVEMNLDAQWHAGHLWIMCNGGLMKFDPAGDVKGVWHFFGRGAEFPVKTRLQFYSFDFFSDGQVVIASVSDNWGSHIFTIDL